MKNLIRNFLKRFGYDIIKTNKWFDPKRGAEQTLKIGNSFITMATNNPLYKTIIEDPDFNTIIGRLASVIARKYPTMTAIDVGANVGDTIAIIKSAVDIPVVGIEGDDVTFKFLAKNVQQFSNVHIRKTFLGEKKQEINVNLDKKGWNTTIIPSHEGTNIISLRSLDELTKEDQLMELVIKLIKIDAEGFDTIILRGAFDLIKRYHPVLFFEYNRNSMKAINEDGLSTLLYLGDIGYQRIVFFDYKGRMLLSTQIKNIEIITQLHNYVSGDNNLLGFYDVCIFNENDEDLALEFLRVEELYDSVH